MQRTVFIVSDSTGITAETFSHSVLSQFEQIEFEQIRMPFIDSARKASEAAQRINRCAEEQNQPPLVFSTLVDPDIALLIRQANCTFLDLFGTFVQHIETALGVKPSHSIGRSHMGGLSKQYNNRIEAINFSLAHDDGQFVHGLEQEKVERVYSEHKPYDEQSHTRSNPGPESHGSAPAMQGRDRRAAEPTGSAFLFLEADADARVE